MQLTKHCQEDKTDEDDEIEKKGEKIMLKH
jgi:hypothetical protein